MRRSHVALHIALFLLCASPTTASVQCFSIRIVAEGQTISDSLRTYVPSCTGQLEYEISKPGAGTLTLDADRGTYSYSAPPMWTSKEFDKILLAVRCDLNSICPAGLELFFKINKKASTTADDAPEL